MKTVALVPIKLNSQRIPHKNILPLAGKPLCWHIVRHLLEVPEIDEVCVYCSDPAVKDFLPEGARFVRRDPALDGDLVKGFAIYDAFLQEVEADVYVLAHTTSPFLTSGSIQNALRQVLGGEHDSAFSARKFQTFAWYQGKPINYDCSDVPRTQDMEPVYVETSGFYIFKKEVFIKHRRRIGFSPYIQLVDDLEAIDIDEPEDFAFAELAAAARSS